jgi:hypothetical protein
MNLTLPVVPDECAIKNGLFLIANKRFKKSIIFNFAKSLAFLFFYFFKNFFKNKKIEKNNFNVTFIDIFVHLKKEAINSGHFYSNYWTSLVDKLPFTGTLTAVTVISGTNTGGGGAVVELLLSITVIVKVSTGQAVV